MWVFGYGSLMWDGWEAKHDCVRRIVADISGFSRSFNKASVRNWGTKARPGPTLNLVTAVNANCRGIAFEFPEARTNAVMAELEVREGGFTLSDLPVRLQSGQSVNAIVPIYDGRNLIHAATIDEIAAMVANAKGTSGRCIDYVRNIAAQLDHLGVDDPPVTTLWRALAKEDAASQ